MGRGGRPPFPSPGRGWGSGPVCRARPWPVASCPHLPAAPQAPHTSPGPPRPSASLLLHRREPACKAAHPAETLPRAFKASRTGGTRGASHSPRWVWERRPRPPTFQARCTCSARASGPPGGVPQWKWGPGEAPAPSPPPPGPRGLPTLSWGPRSHGSGRPRAPRRGVQAAPLTPATRRALHPGSCFHLAELRRADVYNNKGPLQPRLLTANGWVPLPPAEPTWVIPGALPGACEGLRGTAGDPEGASKRPRRHASAQTLVAPPDAPHPLRRGAEGRGLRGPTHGNVGTLGGFLRTLLSGLYLPRGIS